MSRSQAARCGAITGIRIAAATLLTIGSCAVRAETIRFRLVDRDAIEQRLSDYQGQNRERGAKLARMFADAGCTDHLSEQPVKFSKAPNIICTLPGITGRMILVGAHFDRVSTSDGVADNWSGASLLPSLYSALNIEPRQHTYVFIGFTDEEVGLVGSRFYARKMSPEQVAATDAMINLDTLGLAPTEVWTHRSDIKLTQALNGLAQHMKLPLTGVNFERVGSTDSESFAARKIPRISIHSLTQQNHDAGVLHTSKDQLSAMNLDHYYDTYHLVAAYLAFLDHFLQPQ